MSDVDTFEGLLKKKTPLVCMLAPSFIADFDYPELIWMLEDLGFDEVVELTFGAKMTNVQIHMFIKEHKGEKTWIAAPCPTLVQFIRTSYPHLVQNLIPVQSPMGCMALICKKFYPKHKRVFVGPCITKKVEACEIGTVDLALTYKEIEELFEKNGIKPQKKKRIQQTFSKFYNDYTKIYPLAGGLAQTLHYSRILDEKEVLIEDGINKIKEILDGFVDGKYKEYVFADFLACRGGCIGGPGMAQPRTIEEKRERVLKYRDYARRYEKDLGRRGKVVHVEDIDFSRKY